MSNAEVLLDDLARLHGQYADVLARAEKAEAEVARMREVVALAEDWWLVHRPLAFTEAEHLAAPTVNVTRGAPLAKAVARWRTTSATTTEDT